LGFPGLSQAGKTLVVGIDADALTLDPGNFRHRETEAILRNMFDALVTRTPEMEIVPELAVSWERVSDTEWIFYLRDGGTWHDGTPFTAADVERTVKEGRTTPQGPFGFCGRRGGPGSPHGEAHHRRALPCLHRVSPPSSHHLIVPKHDVEAVGDEFFAENPIGTGPFKFVRWDKGVPIVMERYDNYYGARRRSRLWARPSWTA